MTTGIKNKALTVNVLLSAILALASTSPSGFAGTVVHSGSIVPITSASDLDLDGNIVHAINFRGGDVLTIQGVDFVPDDAIPKGTTLLGPNFASSWQTKPELGDTNDDNSLETMFHTMRWSIGSERLKAAFAVKTGHRYKLQVLFYENRDFGRSWDIALNNNVVVEEITSLGTDAATYSANEAVMYVAEIDASQPEISIEMGQLNATIEGVDSGSLWQGITLEDLGPGSDGDADGMPDAFESAFGIDDASDDPDSDDSTNLEEFNNGTDPTNPDSDGDGVVDGSETNTGIWVSATDRGSSPLLADSDGDSLLDGVETNSGTFSDPNDTGTNPNEPDSDSDGFGDGLELVLVSDPADDANLPGDPSQVKLLASWNFNSDDKSATLLPDSVRSITASLQNGASLSNAGGGRSGTPADRAVEFGLRGGAIVEVEDAAFLNLPSKADAASISLWQNSTTISNTTTFWGSTDTSQLRGVSAHLPWSDRILYFDTAGCCDLDSQRTQVSALAGDDEPLVLLGRWHHFVLVKNGSTKQIWLDGNLLEEATNTAVWPDTFFRLFIGASPGGARNIFGAIDDFSVFHGALIPAQIKSLTIGMAPTTIADIEDIDNDTLPDSWEIANNLNTSVDDAGGDPDSDNSTNLDEFLRSTDPQKADTDDDGYNDGVETDTGVFVSVDDTGTDPLNPDSDGDSVEDGKETGTGTYVDTSDRGTNPFSIDSDGDGLEDGVESGTGIFVDEDDTGTNPVAADTDGDGARDRLETNTGVYTNILNTGTNPHIFDTDQDGLRDGAETNTGTFVDSDNTGTHPLLNDTDEDGVLDGAETNTGTFIDISNTGTDPFVKDSDSDTLDDGVETGTGIFVDKSNTGTDPNKTDTDEDGFADGIESATGVFVDANDPGTDPNELDTDTDGLDDGVETATGTFVDATDTGTDPNKADSDSDGLNDGVETASGVFVDNTDTGTDPNNPDSDGDNLNDGVESATGTFVDATDTGTNPNNNDSDADGLGDAVESGSGTFVDNTDTGTDPNKADSDGDDLNDSVESGSGTFVDNTDTGTDPNKADSDGDSISDGAEVAAGSDPNDANSGPDSSPPVIASVVYKFDNSEITITWSSKADALYTIESTGDLLEWTNQQTDIPSNGESTSLTIGTATLGSTLRYLRIREQ